MKAAPVAINTSGQVAGHVSLFSNGEVLRTSFITAANGRDLRLIDAPQAIELGAVDLNASGQVAGAMMLRGDQATRAFVTGPNGQGVVDLSSVVGGSQSWAFAVNGAGQVAGTAFNIVNGVEQARVFMVNPGAQQAADLGTLGGQWAFPIDINDDGFIVGSSDYTLTSNDSHAFVIDGSGVMKNLNGLVRMPAGRYLTRAYGINNDGVILANDNFGRLYQLVPVPELGTPMMFGLALSGLVLIRAKRRKAEVLA